MLILVGRRLNGIDRSVPLNAITGLRNTRLQLPVHH